MRRLIKSTLNRLRKKAESHNGNVICEVGRFHIRLPKEHRLQEILRIHRNYDKFLPHLASYLNNGDIIIDVGANCGDTLAAMVSTNPNLHYICIEPDGEFYSYLQDNVADMRKIFPNVSVDLVEDFISDSELAVGLIGGRGTKHRDNSATSNLLKPRRLVDVADKLCSEKNVRLIKSDVDGYDYDVINSAGKLLDSERVMIFFECEYTDDIQREGYINLLNKLLNIGFSDFWFFDNYGSYMLNTNNSKIYSDLMDYVMRQNQKQSTRTIYYFDILASKPLDNTFLTDVIEHYSNR